MNRNQGLGGRSGGNEGKTQHAIGTAQKKKKKKDGKLELASLPRTFVKVRLEESIFVSIAE